MPSMDMFPSLEDSMKAEMGAKFDQTMITDEMRQNHQNMMDDAMKNMAENMP
jgi:hypothetical protein